MSSVGQEVNSQGHKASQCLGMLVTAEKQSSLNLVLSAMC